MAPTSDKKLYGKPMDLVKKNKIEWSEDRL
ncbi:MAG: hypothetical protein H6Q48_1373 [Deltaproteobacteria bacterium]|nr:hypothetical protein [Deltaproteobacteria bacterium]